jgi:hypothetical protein
MAALTRSLSGEYFLAASCVSNRNRSRADATHGTYIRYDSRQLGVLKLVRRHGRSGNSCDDHASQIFVGDGLPKLAASQIDVRDRIAGRTVAE